MAVRVHVVTPEKTLLTAEQSPTTASVMLQLNPGKTLDQTQVQAITHLVASSIEGLKPENVVVVDSSGRMLASGTGSSGEAGAAARPTAAALPNRPLQLPCSKKQSSCLHRC